MLVIRARDRRGRSTLAADGRLPPADGPETVLAALRGFRLFGQRDNDNVITRSAEMLRYLHDRY